MADIVICCHFDAILSVLQVAAQTQQPGRGWTDRSQPVPWSATLRTHPTRPRLLWACSYKREYSRNVFTSFSTRISRAREETCFISFFHREADEICSFPGHYAVVILKDFSGNRLFPGSKEWQGSDADLSSLLVPWSRKSRAIPLLPLWTVRPVQGLSACTVQLYLYSPYGPYSLYRASVSVQYSYTSTPPLWTVRPVQSLSACTVQLCLYSPYGPYGLYRASLPVQ